LAFCLQTPLSSCMHGFVTAFRPSAGEDILLPEFLTHHFFLQ
jgi:hypothetical protein